MGSGPHSGPAEDKVGLIPWWEGQRWHLGGELLNLASSIKLSMTPHPPIGASGNYFPHGTPRTLHSPITSGGLD